MSSYLGLEYDGQHFADLWDLGYLPIKVKALPEGIETLPNIPHMTFINTVDGYAWLPLFLETIVSNLAWKSSTAATIAKLYRKTAEEWVTKTDKDAVGFIDFMCHDFSARGLTGPHDMISVGLAHATLFRGSDTLITMPAARYFYNEPKNEVCINSVNASEHSVSTTKIFTVGEQQMIADWLEVFPKGVLSIVSDTFDLWKLITEYLPANKDLIMARDGKLVIRPDSGDPVDIICGTVVSEYFKSEVYKNTAKPKEKGVIELLWDIFGGTINYQGYKVLDSHIGCIYGDSITPERQREIYTRLAEKGFAATNIVLGIGSYTYEFLTRDVCGFAAKGSWFELKENDETKTFNIHKDPITDDGHKRSLKGMLSVHMKQDHSGNNLDYFVRQECTPEEESQGILQVIYENGQFYNQTSLTEIRKTLLQQ